MNLLNTKTLRRQRTCSVNGEESTELQVLIETIDNVGHIIVYSGKDIDALAKADPDVKSSGETTNLKIYFYGPDTAIATYNVHFIQTGHKDKKYNSDLELSCLDVWKKLNGEWKALAGSNTSTKPVPPEMYKMEMPPNFPSPTS